MSAPSGLGARGGTRLEPLEGQETRDAARDADIPRILRLFTPYRGQLLLVLVLIVAGAITGVISPFLLRRIVDVALPDQDLRVLAWCVIGLVGVTLASTALGVTQSLVSTRVGQAVMHDLRVAVYGHLQRMGLAFFTRTRTGEVHSRIFSDIGSMQSMITNVMTQIVSSVASIAMALVAMVAMDWRLTLFSLAAVPPAVWINRRVALRRRRIVRRRQEQSADLAASIQESLSVSGILLGTTMGRSAALTETFRSESARLAELEVASTVRGRWSIAAFSALMAIIPALTYLLGGLLLFGGSGAVTIGTLVAFVALQSSLLPNTNNLLRVGNQVSASLALFTRVFEYVDEPVTIEESATAVDLPTVRIRGRMHMEQVSFSYPGAAAPALDRLELVIPEGRHTAIVGATGSGKTTIGYLLARLYDPDAGRITLDGHDLRDLSFSTLAASIGVVTQETYLLHASIRENLLFAAPDATDAELERACRIAQIHDHVVALPEGYDTVVGERGYRFSGGEKQRLALARTILRDPPVLLLDEATSALDVATERAMSGALEALSHGRTTISIAHRLSTVRHADQIIVLEAGRILERGRYQDLLDADGAFAALHRLDAEADADSSD